MLTAKIEFCPLDWYSNSPTAIVLHNKMYYICQGGPTSSLLRATFQNRLSLCASAA